MNKVKTIIISAVALFMVSAVVVSELNNDHSGHSDTISPDTSEDQVTTLASEETQSAYIFHEYPTIEQLIQDYNAIAEFPITVDMLQDSVTRNTLYASCNGVWITIFESMDELWVKFQIDSTTDEAYMPIYRDFLAALGGNLSADEFHSVWKNQITTLGVMDDLTINGLLCNYNDAVISGGKFRYTGSIRKSIAS